MSRNIYYKETFIQCDLKERNLKEVLNLKIRESSPWWNLKSGIEEGFGYSILKERSPNDLTLRDLNDNGNQRIFISYEEGKGIQILLKHGVRTLILIAFLFIVLLVLNINHLNGYTSFGPIKSLMLLFGIGIIYFMPLAGADTIGDEIKTQLHIAGIKYEPQIGNPDLQ